MDCTNRLLGFSFSLQPSQFAFLMIPVPFTALMAAFLSTTERDSGDGEFLWIFPSLAIVPSDIAY